MNKSYVLNIVLPSIFAAIGGFLFGYDTGVISGAILFMEEQFHLQTHQVELIIGIISVGAVIGAILAGPLSDRFGRKKLIIATSIVYILAAFLQGMAKDIIIVIYGRLLVGIAIGLSSTATPLYIAEIAYREKRGTLVTINQLAITIGILCSFFVGYLFASDQSWRPMFELAAIPAAIMLIGMLFFPESPRWLLSKNKEAKAIKILTKLRHTTQDVELEIAHIKRNLAEEGKKFSDFFSRPTRKALLVGVTVTSIQQLIGINSVLYYAPTIFKLAGFTSNVTAILATTGVGAINVLATFIAIYLLDIAGRKKLLLIGLSGLTGILILLGIAFWLPSAIMGWLALICLMAYVTFFAFSLGPIGFLLNSEIYQLNVRGKAMGIAICFNWIANFITTATFLTLINYLGKSFTFWIYAVIGILGIIFTIKKVPETKGKSLEEIENFWMDS